VNVSLPIAAVLFDLDGTLIDSAPDLAGAGNDMRVARGLAPRPGADYRAMVGAGARGMLGIALGVTPESAEFNALRDEFLQRYEARMAQETHAFDGIHDVLAALQERGLPWGIVTNKIERFTLPLIYALGLDECAAAVVCGDTTSHAKPHPAPLLEAARRVGVPAEACIYVGDDLRDIQAGRAAGMHTAAAAWGYLGEGAPIEAWGADHLIYSPNEVLKLLAIA
jgi:N-acetyl-D-muramate 6-phosphate phosphatase